jgi:hypothetical protein
VGPDVLLLGFLLPAGLLPDLPDLHGRGLPVHPAASLHLKWYVPDFVRSWCYAWGPSVDWVKLLLDLDLELSDV